MHTIPLWQTANVLPAYCIISGHSCMFFCLNVRQSNTLLNIFLISTVLLLLHIPVTLVAVCVLMPSVKVQ